MNLRDDYVSYMDQHMVWQLHVSKDSVLIPDLQPVAGDDLVEIQEPYSGKPSTPQMITTLGLALGLITQVDGNYEFSFDDEDAKLLDIHRLIHVKLGPTKAAAVGYFYENTRHLDVMRDQVRAAMDKLGGSGNGFGIYSPEQLKVVNVYILNYLEKPPMPLEDWEDLRLRSFYEGVNSKLRASYAQSPIDSSVI
jgi:hypothetical protein